MAYLAEERGITPVYVPELGRELHPLRDLVTLVKLWRLMRRLKPMSSTRTPRRPVSSGGGRRGWRACRCASTPFTDTCFTAILAPRRHASSWRERLTARLTDRLITIGPALRDELSGVYRVAPAEKFAVVRWGWFWRVCRRAARMERPRRMPDPPDAPLIGIVGRIVPIKNHALFLEMASRVLQSQPDAYFLIVGDGEERPAIEALADRLGLRTRAVFTGWMRDLVPVFSDLDLLVLSSNNEARPRRLCRRWRQACRSFHDGRRRAGPAAWWCLGTSGSARRRRRAGRSRAVGAARLRAGPGDP